MPKRIYSEKLDLISKSREAALSAVQIYNNPLTTFKSEPSRVGSAHQKHCIWRLPDGDVDYSLCWALIKAEFTKKARGWLGTPNPTASRKKHREGTVWQRRFLGNI